MEKEECSTKMEGKGERDCQAARLYMLMIEGKGKGDASKTVKQNDQKKTYVRRQSVQRTVNESRGKKGASQM